MELRPATSADLGWVYDVWYATEISGLTHPPPPRTMPWFTQLLAVGQLVVAVAGDTVVGFVGVVDHGSCVALSDLFVHPSWQSQGIGGALLDAVLPPDRPLVTMASADPRAVASYARRGIRPQWPAYYLAAAAEELRPGEDCVGTGVGLTRLSPDAYSWELAGDDHHYEPLGAIPLAAAKAGRDLGTALILSNSPQRLSHPDTTEIVETTAVSADAAADLVVAVVRHLVQEGATRVMAQVPGPHPALPSLLRLGFRITDVDMACATDAGLLADPARHTMHGESRVQRR